MVEDVSLSDRILPLRVHVNARARRMTLRIETGGRALRVTVPPGTREAQVVDFVGRLRGWLEVRLAGLPPPVPQPMLRDGVKIPYLGVPHLLTHKAGRGVTRLGRGEDGQEHIIIHGEAAHLPRHLRDFLHKQAQMTIAPLVAAFAREVGRKPKSIRYKDTKSRWGSCTAQGALSFSWRIIMAPPGVVRYLVAHEVAHLVEMNHGIKFWHLCEKLCPETKNCRAWLKRNGQALHAIDFSSL